jgi:hypothetical protein
VSVWTATVPPDVLEIMARVTAAGVRLSPSGADLRFSAPGPLAPELRELIVAHKEAFVAALSVWCPRRAELLQHETDTLIAGLDCGNDPDIAAAAARCVEAHAREDMATVRLMCHLIADRIKKLAATPTPQVLSPDPRMLGDVAAEACADRATRGGWDAEAVAEFMLAYLREHGATSGEVLVTRASEIHPAHDSRAFGAVLAKLSRAGQIAPVGHARREKGHSTTVANIWSLKERQQ